MSYTDSNMSRRNLMSRGALALGTSVITAGSADSALATGVSFSKHQVVEKGPGCLRVAACQILSFPDVAESTEKVLKWIEAAAEDDADVILFPEA